MRYGRIARRFARAEPRRRSLAYLKALLGPIERKNGWQIAEQAGEAMPDGMQRLLAASCWDAERVRDETNFLKKGRASVGVQRQYSGTAGSIDNCQPGIFLAYASQHGRAFLDREWYSPEEWTGDRDRCEAAGVPGNVCFQTKPKLARRMLERAFAAGVRVPWVLVDEVYGGDRPLRRWLEARGQRYALAVRSIERAGYPWHGRSYTLSPPEVLRRIPPDTWVRLSAGAGAKGPRFYEWTLTPLAEPVDVGQGRWLLVRRSLTDPTDLAFHRCYGPANTGLPELVRAAGSRWAVESRIEEAKGEVGLDQHAVRKWASWYRHGTRALRAFAFLAVTRARATLAGRARTVTRRADTGTVALHDLLPLTVPEVRRLLWHVAWSAAPPEPALRWSRWRRQHHARAKSCHHQRRLQRRAA